MNENRPDLGETGETHAARELSPGRKTSLWRQSAFLRGQGVSAIETARALGANRVTISNFARDAEWLAERDRWTEHMLARLEPLLQRLRAGAIVAHEEALETALEALRATDSVTGQPLWTARLRAVEAILGAPIIRALVGDYSGHGADATTQVVSVYLHEGDSAPRVEIVQGEVVKTDEGP